VDLQAQKAVPALKAARAAFDWVAGILIFPLPGGAKEVGCEVDYRHYPHKEHEKGR